MTDLASELYAIASQTACEAVRAREAVLELRNAADARTDGTWVNDVQIRQVAKAYGIPVRHRQLYHIVLNLTDVLLDEISSADTHASKTIRVFAPERDLREWQSRGVLPLSAYHEAARSVALASASGTGDDARATQLERCQLALAYPASRVARIAQAAISGETKPMLGVHLA